MRLIDETEYQELLAKIPMEERTFRKAVEVAEDMPTIDAVPVVRCKDCKHRDANWDNIGFYCGHPHHGMAVGVKVWDNDFCSYGERKDGDGE